MKPLYLILGLISLGLGAIAAAIPLLPSFPFLVLAGLCFARSSKKLSDWFLQSSLYRNNLESYLNGRGMTKAAKIRITLSITLTMGIGFYFMHTVPWARWILAVIWLSHLVYFWFGVKTIAHKPSSKKQESDA